MNTTESREGISRKRLLLIVLAVVVVLIIGKLVAIGLPGFLNAQVRAKVSRAYSEMRSIVDGLETYKTDHGIYPPSLNKLTTPIAYLPSSFAGSVPADPHAKKGERYGYRVGTATYEYLIIGVGPDNTLDTPSDLSTRDAEKALLYYSFSNGILSRGDIIRTGPERHPN